MLFTYPLTQTISAHIVLDILYVLIKILSTVLADLSGKYLDNQEKSNVTYLVLFLSRVENFPNYLFRLDYSSYLTPQTYLTHDKWTKFACTESAYPTCTKPWTLTNNFQSGLL